MKTGHRNTLTPLIHLVSSGLSVSPIITCAGIQENGDEEEVDQAAGRLCLVTSLLLPLLYDVSDTRDISDFEMLPASMRGDGVEFVRAIITLRGNQ